MLEFTFRKEVIVYTPQMFMVPEFVALYKADRTKDKAKSEKWFLYIFLLASLSESNPNKDVPYNKRDEEAKYRVYKNRNHEFTDNELKVLIPAVDIYTVLNTNAEERSLTVFDSRIEKIRQELEDTDPLTFAVITKGSKIYKTNSKIISNGLQSLDKVKTTKISVIASVRRSAMNNKVRGQVVLSPLSKGNIELASIGEWENSIRDTAGMTNDDIDPELLIEEGEDAVVSTENIFKDKPVKFDLYKGNLLIDKDTLEIDALKSLYDLDKSTKKADAIKCLKYVFMRGDYSHMNPINDVRFDKKEEYARLLAFGDSEFNIEDAYGEEFVNLIEDALVEYKDFIPEAETEIDTYNKKLDQLCDMLNILRPTIDTHYDETAEGDKTPLDFSTNINIIIETLENIVKIILSKASLVSIHIEGKAPKQLRGRISPLSRGTLDVKQDPIDKAASFLSEDDEDGFLML